MNPLKPINKGNGHVLVFGRLTYQHLFEKHSMSDDQEGKYQTGLIIPQDDEASIKAVEKAIEEAIKEGVVSKWKGKKPAKLTLPLRDGSEKEGEEFQNAVFFNAKSSKKVSVLNQFKQPADEEEIYSGCYGYLSVRFYPYDSAGNKGVAAGLNSFLKVADGKTLGGGGDGSHDFDELEIPNAVIEDSLDDL